ncbi:hypothetical protein NSR00_02580 [Aeribacillus sp. FSL K6-8394]|uniref:hypothetical protein n=1 Tax=Aeribacillus TaxID=1055323 RepID=UPI0030FBC0D8
MEKSIAEQAVQLHQTAVYSTGNHQRSHFSIRNLIRSNKLFDEDAAKLDRLPSPPILLSPFKEADRR